MSKTRPDRDDQSPVIVSGVRTPFMRSNNAYRQLASWELAKAALAGLIARSEIDPELIQHLVMGTVIHEPNTPNVARESMLAASLPASLPAHTVSLACISSNVAAINIAQMIQLQHIDVGIFSGVDTCSDPPIRVSRNLRQFLVKLQKINSKTLWKQLGAFSKLHFKDFSLEIPKVVEFSNGKTMGQGAEILAKSVGITRADSDRFAERSHRLAVEAAASGFYAKDIVDVYLPPKFQPISEDDGPRKDTTFDKLAKLRPAFDHKFGVCTAGNSSFLTDGASAVLMMSQSKAKELGQPGLAYLRDYVYGAGDPLNDMLSGPSLTVPKLLARNNLSYADIDVWEVHEAFAAQVLANLRLLNDREYVDARVGTGAPIGEIAMEKLNTRGGSLSLGHPFGATGGRLLWTAARRLQEEGARYAVVTGCAAGGHGSAMLLERTPDA